jgi:hypothetical protein
MLLGSVRLVYSKNPIDHILKDLVHPPGYELTMPVG